MIRFLVLLFCCLIGAQSKCLHAPVGQLPEGCNVGNLTVGLHSSPEVINRMKCNITADAGFFNYPPQTVSFQHVGGYAAPAYLMIAVDRTSKSVMWIVTNTTMSANWRIYPSANGYYTKEIIPWKKPFWSQSSRHHVIEFLVFEERRNYSWNTYNNYSSLYVTPFNLSNWIDSQQNNGITLCGPVGGGSVVGFQQSPAPAPGATPRPGGSTPYHPPSPANHHQHKSNSNRNLFDGVLLVGVLFVFRVFAF